MNGEDIHQRIERAEARFAEIREQNALDAARKAAPYGLNAILVGTPSHDQNEGLEGLRADTVDTIANVLHALYVSARRELRHELAVQVALGALDSARARFDCALRGDF